MPPQCNYSSFYIVDSFVYSDGTKAMGEINLDIKKGEFSGMLGSNGSCMTAFLKSIEGLIKDFNGNVHLYGNDMRKLSRKEIFGKVGLVFQSPDEQLFAGTVAEDLSFGVLNMGFKGRGVTKRVKEALDDVKLAGYDGKSIHNMSYGQKKRVFIAGLLDMGYEILLLDEPTTTGLDPMGECRIMSLLKKQNAEKDVTIIMPRTVCTWCPSSWADFMFSVNDPLSGEELRKMSFLLPTT